MNYEEHHRTRTCNGAIWVVCYTTFWRDALRWAGALHAWVQRRASETATYKLLKGGHADV
jgi:hypothetical protein